MTYLEKIQAAANWIDDDTASWDVDFLVDELGWDRVQCESQANKDGRVTIRIRRPSC